MVWLGKKADLAVDEVIKNSIRAVTWTRRQEPPRPAPTSCCTWRSI